MLKSVFMIVVAVLMIALTIFFAKSPIDELKRQTDTGDQLAHLVAVLIMLGVGIGGAIGILYVGNINAGIDSYEDELLVYEQEYMNDVIKANEYINESEENEDAQTLKVIRANDQTVLEIKGNSLTTNISRELYEQIDIDYDSLPIEYVNSLENSQTQFFGLIDVVTSPKNFHLLNSFQ